MIKLSNERIEQILHEETVKKEKSATILRGIYNRYMRLYEDYFADIDALNDDKIAEFRNYHEETRSLIKYYYMDIPRIPARESKNLKKSTAPTCSDLNGMNIFSAPMKISKKKAKPGIKMRSIIRLSLQDGSWNTSMKQWIMFSEKASAQAVRPPTI